jgi:hypothetical protein
MDDTNLYEREEGLLRAFHDIPEGCNVINAFRLAYLYRREDDELAESGSEEDPTGLVAALTRVLNIGVDHNHDQAVSYRELSRGIFSIPDSFMEHVFGSYNLADDIRFRFELYNAVEKVPAYNINLFYDRLLSSGYINMDGGGKLAFSREDLKEAVIESLSNYADAATLGAKDIEEVVLSEGRLVEVEISDTLIPEEIKTPRLSKLINFRPTRRSKEGTFVASVKGTLNLEEIRRKRDRLPKRLTPMSRSERARAYVDGN